MKNLKRLKDNNKNRFGIKGFTLTETLVAIFIFIMAIGAVSGLVLLGYRSQSYTWQRSMAIKEARRGVEVMIKEIREADSGENGAFSIESAGDKEFVFYSDIDNDGKTERVRYFLGTINSGSQTKNCVTYAAGGSCNVSFNNFLQGTLTLAQVKVSVEGDLGASNEYVEIFADGTEITDVCQSGCSDCAGAWQGTTILDVASQASDGVIQFLADANFRVDPYCDWEESDHSMKASFEFSWTDEVPGEEHELRKGVIEPVGIPVTYPLDQEETSVVSSYVRNVPPIFEYFDANGNKIVDYPARLIDTKLMKIFLVINADLDRPPQDFELESSVQLRNLKED